MTNIMEKFASWLEEHFLPIASAIGNQRHLVALRDGFIATMPVSMSGALVVMFKEVIFTSESLFGTMLNKLSFYAENIQPVLDRTLVPVLEQMWWGTLALGIIFSVFTIAYKLAEHYKQDALSAGVLAVVSYLILLPQAVEGGEWGTISWTSFNSEAIFTGLIVAMVSTEIFNWVVNKGWVIKMPDKVPPAVSKAFSAMIPAFFVLTFFGIVSVCFQEGLGIPMQQFINNAIQIPLTKLGQSPFTFILLVFIAQILWFFGLHGITIIGPVLDTMYSPALAANAEAIMIKGVAPTNAITRNMLDLYGMHGGSGATLALIIAIFLVSKRAEYKSLAKMSLMPGVFQINEPIIYGLPIVLNPILAIPFIIIPPITVFIGWLFTAVIPFAGFVYIDPPWVVPPVLNAFLATGGDIKAAILAFATLVIAILIYMPFIMIANKMEDSI
ncbi:MAG: PTS transporter subunit EIIC [Erysipelothrix sp.]